jgi:hypothetical protein
MWQLMLFHVSMSPSSILFPSLLKALKIDSAHELQQQRRSDRQNVNTQEWKSHFDTGTLQFRNANHPFRHIVHVVVLGYFKFTQSKGKLVTANVINEHLTASEHKSNQWVLHPDH